MNKSRDSHEKVSVVLPVYNGEKHLAPAIESILSQTYENFEIIIIDDGSIDRSREIILGFSDPRIRYVKQDHRGLVAALNRGIELATGRFIARMDADDISLSSRIEEQVAFLREHPEIAVVSCFVERFYDNKILPPWEADRKAVSSQELRKTLPWENCYAHPAAMFRVEILKEYRYDETQTLEDWDLWLRLIADGHRLGKIPKVLYRYRIHETSITSSWEKNKNLPILFYLCRQRFLKKRKLEKKWGEVERETSLANATYVAHRLSLSEMRDVISLCGNKKDNEDAESKEIVLICRRLYDGGIERASATLANMLAAEGYAVIVLTEEGPSANDFSLSPSVRREVLSSFSPQKWELFFRSHPSALYLVNEDLREETYRSMVFWKAMGATVVAISHNSWLTAIHPSARHVDTYKTRLEIYRVLDGVVVLSLVDKAYYREKGIRNVFYIPPTISLMARQTASLEDPVVMWCGRFSYEKRPESMIDAFALVHQAIPESKLLMVGQGELLETCRKNARVLGIENEVVFTGYVKDVENYWQHASIHCLTSRFESFSLSWLEAKSYGVPTVMFDMPYLALARFPGYVAVEQGNTYLLAKEIVALLKDYSKRRELGMAALSSFSEFSSKSIISRWRCLFDFVQGKSTADTLLEEALPARDLINILISQGEHLGLEGCEYVSSVLENRWPARWKRLIDFCFPRGSRWRRMVRSLYHFMRGSL